MKQETDYPLFTVIIPQKDRVEYLEYTLRTCMIQDYPNLEFIVADDCSEDGSAELVKRLAKEDPRIKLIEHTHHVGMRDNFEEALAMVGPGYVMALGGDDGLLPGCFWKMYEIIKETGSQLITWPLHVFHYADGDKKRRLLIRKREFSGIKMIKSEDYLNNIARTFNYMTFDCPMFYVKGVASTELVEKVKQRTPDHCFYYCPTPDGFSGVVLAGELEEYVYYGTPLTINGASPKSQGLSYKRTDKRSKEQSEQFFKDNVRRTMHKELASQQYSPLVTLMTADYLLTAKDLPGWPGKFEMFSYEELIKATFNMLVRNPFANEVLIREMKILREIAKQHNLLPLFEDLHKNTKRKLTTDNTFDGFRILKTMYEFDAENLGVKNVYDAALACNFAYEALNSMNAKLAFRCIKSMVKTVLNKFRYKVTYLPEID